MPQILCKKLNIGKTSCQDPKRIVPDNLPSLGTNNQVHDTLVLNSGEMTPANQFYDLLIQSTKYVVRQNHRIK